MENFESKKLNFGLLKVRRNMLQRRLDGLVGLLNDTMFQDDADFLESLRVNIFVTERQLKEVKRLIEGMVVASVRLLN